MSPVPIPHAALRKTPAPRRLPSLQGRLLWVLLAALGGVVAVLLAVDFLSYRRSVAEGETQRVAAQSLGESLDGADEAVAVRIVQATERQFNRSRQNAGLQGIQDLQFQLQTRDGRVAYASPALAGRPAVLAAEVHPPVLRLDGRAYWPGLHEGPLWRVLLLEPVVEDGLALRWLGGGLLPSVLLAVPLLMLPLWWAVRTGLAPLRRLAQAVAQRPPTSVQPLGLALRHAELQPLADAIDGLLDRVRRQLAHERTLMHDTAHELRTPLAVVAAQAHALVHAPDPEAREAALQGLQRGVQRSSHLVEQLLSLARLESPAAAPVAEPVDLVQACQRHLIDLDPLAQARGIELSLSAPPRAMATLPPAALHSVLDNLLRNALQHCPPGAQVELRLATGPNGHRLEVLDDGPGLPPDERERAFERFFRGAGAGPGSGLGLTIVREAARQLGGTANLSAGVGGRGLRVVVEWPA